MTPEQKAAFIISQTAMFNAEIVGMVSENQKCKFEGKRPKYEEQHFINMVNNSGLTHNAVITFFEA